MNDGDMNNYRSNHIHHAIDAFVLACMGMGNYKKLSDNADRLERSADYYGQNRKEKFNQIFDGLNSPYDGFDYFKFWEKTKNTPISYRPNKKDPKSSGTIGKLHEDTAYALVEFQRGTTAKFSRFEKLTDLKEKDFKYVNSGTLRDFMSIRGKQNENATFTEFFNWANAYGLQKVRMIYEDRDATTYIPIFRKKQDREEYIKTYLDWYIQDGIAAGITDKKLKVAQKEKEHALLAAYQNAAKKAYKWYRGGNNFQADVYEIRGDDKRYPKSRGAWQIEIVSNYDAETNGGGGAWKKKYPTARRVMTLRTDDIVRAEFDANDDKLPQGLIAAIKERAEIEKKNVVEINLRVKKLNSNGTIYLRPDWIAKEPADTKSWASSASSLKKHKARKVYISPTGIINDPGFSK